MTELLTREKEFMEINEKLNKMAAPNQSTSTPKNVTKFTRNETHKSPINGSPQQNGVCGTYTKAKGPTTLLKKQGAGDFTSDSATPKKATDTYTKGNLTHRAGALQNDKRDNRFNTMRKKFHGSPRGVGVDTSTSVVSRKTNPPERTFVMRYKNPNFVASPSLELIVRDELSSLDMERQSAENSPGKEQALVAAMNTDLLNKSREYKTAGERKKFSTDGLIKFLKSKVTILEDQHGTLSRELSKQKELLDKALERAKLVEQQRDQAYAKNNSISEQLHKVEAQLEEANTRIKERANTQVQQQKDLEELRRELKMVTQTNANLEKRLFRAQEELDNSKKTITSMKTAEREYKETVRVEAENKEKQLKNLKKLRADLFNAYKKQLYLIDNLSRQNVCLEQAAMVGITEKEFNKVLDWNGTNESKS